ncbi:hypothetical protein [Acinetobacter sp. LMB-5]|uniref:hypothetical protein n=1 Tax=Acinetobacter sp. LMB-5 TaxID=1609919 RepID=UPI0009D6A5A9|nr:hypothetical protein [Acinetobacter sp. LMB-5]
MLNIITDRELENIRNYTFEMHCPSVKIYQQQGLILEGYGIIKINDFGTFYLEFICLKKENIPYLRWDIRLPDDILDESQKLYLEATDTQGKIFKSHGFRLSLNLISINKTSIHHILLSELTIKHQSTNSKNFLYLEFNQSINIPRNKSNKITSTLGSSSISWNESIINFDEENYKIRIVNDSQNNQNYITVEGAENFDTLLSCLTFYLGISSGILLQPYYSKYSSNNEEIITLYSTNKIYLNKCYIETIPSPLGDKEYQDGEYHFNILRKSIQLNKESPEVFLSIYAQWKRTWYSYNSEQDITNLTLTTAIEGLLNDIFIPVLSELNKDEKLENDIKEVKGLIKSLEIDQLYKNRIIGSISYLKIITANKALNLLVDSNLLKKDEIEAWKALRNEVAHPKAKNFDLSKEYERKENFILCLNLFNSLIFQTLSYIGPRNYFTGSKDTKILIFTPTKLAN